MRPPCLPGFQISVFLCEFRNGKRLVPIVTGLQELVIQRHSSSNFPQLDSFSQGLLAYLFNLDTNALWHQTLQHLEKLKNLGRISLFKQYKCRTIESAVFNNFALTGWLGQSGAFWERGTGTPCSHQGNSAKPDNNSPSHSHLRFLCGIQLHTS